jgi:hypothetical protein
MHEHYADAFSVECLKDEFEIEACTVCGAPFEEFGYMDPADGKCYCADCLDRIVAPIIQDAKQFAEERCAITRPFPAFFADMEYRCTPEDYDSGARESYTENSYRTTLRHDYTNYDDLIKDYCKDSTRGRVFYHAIRERIKFLIEEAIDENDLIHNSFDDEEGDEQ